MQRDMDLIRKLLIGIVDRDFSSIYNEYSREVIDYHMDLLEQEGYIEYTFKTKSGSTIKGLTWKGHDFLEVIKKDTFWEKIKPELKKHTIPLSFEIIVPFIKEIIARQFSQEK